MSFFESGTVVLLGVGGEHGSSYKLDVIRQVRNRTHRLIVVEVDGHWSRGLILGQFGADHFLGVSAEDQPIEIAEALAKQFEDLGVQPTVVVTYRQEWLHLRAILAQKFGLNGPSLHAVDVSTDKMKTKHMLRKIGLPTPHFDRLPLAGLVDPTWNPAYPVFIRPVTGIRSEWARALHNVRDTGQFHQDFLETAQPESKDFIVEELLTGHEVDADLFLWKGELLYGSVSDNFPVHQPFALETGHLMPSALAEEIQEQVLAVALKAVLAAGFRDGNMHVELIVGENGNVYLVEINARMGGMYIADWHREIHGVDLIGAELASAAGHSPHEYLRQTVPTRAFAQLCITANPAAAASSERSVQMQYGGSPELASQLRLESWYNRPEIELNAMSGALNLGSVTVEGSTPLDAFAKLVRAVEGAPLSVVVNDKESSPDLATLYEFGASTILRRYSLREATPEDSGELSQLLAHLTPRARGNGERPQVPVDGDTDTLCVVDTFLPQHPIVGTITVHFWNKFRAGKSVEAYLHDLVVEPKYRGRGIAPYLLKEAVERATRRKCYKVSLDCEPPLEDMYARFGFTRAGISMSLYI